MADSTKAARSQKPRKPHKTTDTLTPRDDGRWCKRYKVNGVWKWWYFRGTEQEALDEWNRVKPDLLDGREPRGPGCIATVAKACNDFLVANKIKLHAGQLSPRTFAGYNNTTDELVDAFGKERAIEHLRPD